MSELYEVNILGRKIKVRSDRSPDAVREVETFLNSRISEIKSKAGAVSSIDIAILAALNITEDHLRNRDSLRKLEKNSFELQKLVDEALEESA